MDEEVYNDNEVYKWYERSMVRIVNGTKSPDTRQTISWPASTFWRTLCILGFAVTLYDHFCVNITTN